ncbi:class I SAM-dependent methyltransferase [Rossellomorea sp. NRS-1567]|uniref:class I SAM-dependent methyltransferase n=1 Tax=Rossellomorea sp. NRS-1567 TaxID=3233901 RepID=UPI003D2C3C06
MNNRCNEWVYKLWSPLYDTFFNSGVFRKARQKVFQGEAFHENQRILFVGVGTGADLQWIHHQTLNITAIDYSNEMLGKARKKFPDSRIQFLKMDAQKMSFHDHQFDVVIGSLILSVVPDADQCLKEMLRVLKKDGELILFDKFAPEGRGLSPIKKVLRPLIKLAGTDIGLSFEALVEKYKGTLSVKEDIPLMFNGMYRKIVIKNIIDE